MEIEQKLRKPIFLKSYKYYLDNYAYIYSIFKK